jgi:acyl carrier protein
MDLTDEIVKVLTQVLSLGQRAQKFGRETPLIGAIPELDSMAVVGVITALEERLGIVVDDDIDGSTFATVGSLEDYVAERLAH